MTHIIPPFITHIRSSVIHWTNSPNRFFGVQVYLLQTTLQKADANDYYSNLTASRMEGVENVEIMEKKA
jgi:hypothetical protein